MFAAPAAADQGFADGQAWGIEIGVGGGDVVSTPYTSRLQAFGYARDRQMHFRASLAVERIVFPYLSVLLQCNLLDRQRWSRPSGIGPDDEFDWTSWTLDAHVRGFYPLPKGRGRLYAQLGVGPTFTRSNFAARTRGDSDVQNDYRDFQVRYNVMGLVGLEGMAGDYVGLFLHGGYAYSPAPRNRLGDAHRGGGLLLAGMSIRFGRQL